MSGSDATTVKAARTSFEIVEAVAELDGAGISELARHLDRSKSGVYKHVHTLSELGYLVEEEGGTYQLGLGLWTLGTDVRDRLVSDSVRSVIEDLAASIGHLVTVVGYEAGTVAVVHTTAPTGTDVRPFEAGESLPLHATAAGKAILAYLPEAERESLLTEELPAYTDATITDRSALRDALAEVRERRLARDHGKYKSNLACVATPIVDDAGRSRGAITVTAGGTGGLDADESLIVSAAKSVENVLTD